MAASAAATSSGKKRKVWARSVNISNNSTPAVKITSNSGRTVNITNSSGRTVNITATNKNQSDRLTSEQLEAATMGMNPEDSAKYIELHKAHIKRMGSAERSSRRGGQGGTEVKISFGPSRPPTSSSDGGKNNSNTSATATAASMAAMAAMMGGSEASDCSNAVGSSSINFGDLDLEALKEKAAAAAAGQNTFRNKHGLPCTEAEMKALMSMFVEIMGMSMNNSKGGNNSGVSSGVATNNSNDSKKSANSKSKSSSSSKHGPVFSFGSNPMEASSLAAMAAAASGTSSGMIPDHMAAATAGFFADGASWEALRRTYAAAEQMAAAEDDDDEDDDDDDESFENRELTFEEVEFLLHHRKQKEEAAKLASQFASGDWESLEQVAINDHLLESDDRERKASKKREKKQRRKAKLKEEAAQKAAEAAQKKREKAIVSWRSRVVSACQSNEITKLDGLLQETPLRKLMEEDNDEAGRISTSSIISHLEFLLPNSVAKNRAHVERGIEARLRLAEYVLRTELLLTFKPLRSGRTALHTACFHGDVRFLQLLFDKVDSYEPKEGNDPLPESFLNLTCDESGWSPLHYAAVSGSSEVMELLLEKGSTLSTLTDVTHTWKESDGRGITPRELVQYVKSDNYEKVIETHGLALQEMTNAFFNHHQERRVFLRKLEFIYERLSDVEKNGYTPISKDNAKIMTVSETTNEDSAINRSEVSSRSKKKKKKKKNKSGKETESKPSVSNTADQSSPASVQSDSTEVKQEKDPLVTALLGMGFNEIQILAAVRACGGTHRATADDLVTWILGQGDDEVIIPEASSTDTEKQQEKIDNNDQPNKEDSPTRDEKVQKEEDARQQEETIRRLAAKRDEARRRNREWNNREQARQEQEAKAKVAQKALVVPRPSVPVPPLGMDVSLQTNAPSHIPNGMHSTSSVPAYYVSGMKTSTRQPQMVLATPEMTSGGQWATAPVTIQSQSFAGSSQSKNTTPHTAGSAPTLTTTQQPVLPASSFFSSINDDDKTVSSFGSNRGFSVSSKEFVPTNYTATPTVPLAAHGSVPPPGFMSTTAQPMSVPLRPPVATVPEDSSAVTFSEDNQQGEIRATAKAFVPSSFGQNSLPGGTSMQNEYIASHGRGTTQTVFPPGLLQKHGTPVGHNSLLRSSLPNSFDHAPSMTQASEDSTTPGTIFVNGPSAEEPPLSVPFRFPQGESRESNHIGGSRVLSSISRKSTVGTTSIWGDSQNIPSLESTLQPSFFGDGNQKDFDNEKNNSWSIPGGNGQGSIW